MRPMAFAFVLILFLSAPARAEWLLDLKGSDFTFGSVKNVAVAEVHHFTNLDASIQEDGAFSFKIALDGFDTGIEIRNQRMREFLFDTERFPNAAYSGTLDIEALRRLKTGQRAEVGVTGILSLYGHQQPLEVRLVVTRLGEKRVLITPGRSIYLNAGDFGLLPGLEKLRQLAGLKAISPVVPINFYLVFVERP